VPKVIRPKRGASTKTTNSPFAERCRDGDIPAYLCEDPPDADDADHHGSDDHDGDRHADRDDDNGGHHDRHHHHHDDDDDSGDD
jgi:hypothetical protein